MYSTREVACPCTLKELGVHSGMLSPSISGWWSLIFQSKLSKYSITAQADQDLALLLDYCRLLFFGNITKLVEQLLTIFHPQTESEPPQEIRVLRAVLSSYDYTPISAESTPSKVFRPNSCS